jgi:hypothetical protein
MNEQQSNSPRRRLQELLAIPERQRTDAQWDEINELEIALAQVNRTQAPASGAGRNAAPPPNHRKPEGGAQGRKKVRKRVPKGNAP